MDIGKNKSLFLIAPGDFEINRRIKEELEKNNFEVFLYNYVPTNKIPIFDILIHNFYKIFKRDKTYKTRIRPVVNRSLELKFQKKLLEKVTSFDYFIAIRPDIFPPTFLEGIKAKSQISIGYQWDGMNRFPKIKDIINIFDRFYIFDKNDIKDFPNTIPITNFYFEEEILNDSKQDVFFIGSYLPERMELINSIAKKLNHIGLKNNINILCHDEKVLEKRNEYHFNLIEKAYTFKENHTSILSSNYIIDLANPIHNGLSFRTFESLGYRKKLITNNILVKQYDFYDPNNIFIFENVEMEGIEEFIEKSYKELPPEIYEKYCFSNWIKNVLDIPPYIEIKLP